MRSRDARQPDEVTTDRARPVSEGRVRRLLASPALLAQLSDFVTLCDAQHRIAFVNRAAPSTTVEQLVGRDLHDLVAPSSRAAFRAAIEACARSRQPADTLALGIDGRWWQSRIVPVESEGEPFLFLASVDVTERKRDEAALAERESRLRDAIHASGLGTWSWDSTSDVVTWDDNGAQIFGVEGRQANAGRAWFLSRVHPEDQARMGAHIGLALETGVCDDIELRIVRGDGEVRTVFSRGSVVLDALGRATGMRGGVIDVTARTRLEEQLRHVQKMEAVGQLTAGIAHNFNNLISVVLPNVELCRARAPRELHPLFDDVLHAAERATEMVRQLMRFARSDHGHAKVAVELGALASHTVGICRATFDRRIAIELSTGEVLPPVLACAGEIEQVLLNLCINARDALHDARVEAPRIVIALAQGAPGWVTVTVSDNGPGIEVANRERVFEPFFTTKEVGKGTGLGLASAYAIVAEHGGRIRCECPLEGGCAFVIELPVASSTPPTPEPVKSVGRGASARILLVDDESMVRRALRAVLEQAGFEVDEASDGAEGLAQVDAGAVDLIVLDRSMPRMSGEQFLARLGGGARRPPVVLLTGCPGGDDALDGVSAVMLKPARSSELVATIRRLLDSA